MSVGAEPDKVIVDPEKLAEHHPDELSSLRYPDSTESLDGMKVRQIVGHTAKVVNPIRVRDELMPGLVLPDLLNPPVMVTDVEVDIGNSLTVEGDDEAHQAMGPHVLGSYIQYKKLLMILLPLDESSCIERLVLHGRFNGIRGHIGCTAGMALTKGVAFPIGGMMRRRNRMAYKLNPNIS
jgi:hypothetical protein